MKKRQWPGNVRELRNAVERLLILSDGKTVSESDVQLLGTNRNSNVTSFTACETYDEFKQAAERDFLTTKLEENAWNVSETARKLAMPRSNLYKKIEKYGLNRDG